MPPRSTRETVDELLRMTTTTIRVHDERRFYRLGHPVMHTLAAVAALGVVWLTMPDIFAATAIGQAIPGPFEFVWGVAYSLGGALVLIGFRRHPSGARQEVFGLMLLAGAYTAYAYAILAINGFQPGGLVASILIALAYGCARRAYILRFEPEHSPWLRRS